MTRYSMSIVHRIGVEAPVQSVFEELLRRDGQSSCRPDPLAEVVRIDGKFE